MIGGLALAAALAAQANPADPLAPLPQAQTQSVPSTQPDAVSVQPQPQPPVVQPQLLPPVIARPTIPIPRDWRGVFAAIRAGNWAAAQAGINALPPDILTPVAKAELYTAKGSPAVDLSRI